MPSSPEEKAYLRRIRLRVEDTKELKYHVGLVGGRVERTSDLGFPHWLVTHGNGAQDEHEGLLRKRRFDYATPWDSRLRLAAPGRLATGFAGTPLSEQLQRGGLNKGLLIAAPEGTDMFCPHTITFREGLNLPAEAGERLARAFQAAPGCQVVAVRAVHNLLTERSSADLIAAAGMMPFLRLLHVESNNVDAAGARAAAQVLALRRRRAHVRRDLGGLGTAVPGLRVLRLPRNRVDDVGVAAIVRAVTTPLAELFNKDGRYSFYPRPEPPVSPQSRLAAQAAAQAAAAAAAAKSAAGSRSLSMRRLGLRLPKLGRWRSAIAAVRGALRLRGRRTGMASAAVSAFAGAGARSKAAQRIRDGKARGSSTSTMAENGQGDGKGGSASELVALDLAGNSVSAEGCAELGRLVATTDLAALVLSSNATVGADGVAAFARSILLDRHRAPRSTTAALCHLQLDSCGIGNGGAKSLASLADMLPQLRFLSCQDCDIGNSGFRALVRSVCGHPSLAFLDCGHNRIGDLGFKVFAKRLFRPQCVADIQGFSGTGCLTECCLGFNAGITDQGAAAFAAHLVAVARQIVELTRVPRRRRRGRRTITTTTTTTTTTTGPTTDAGAADVTLTFSRLDLKHNSITDVGVLAISQAMQQLRLAYATVDAVATSGEEGMLVGMKHQDRLSDHERRAALARQAEARKEAARRLKMRRALWINTTYNLATMDKREILMATAKQAAAAKAARAQREATARAEARTRDLIEAERVRAQVLRSEWERLQPATSFRTTRQLTRAAVTSPSGDASSSSGGGSSDDDKPPSAAAEEEGLPPPAAMRKEDEEAAARTKEIDAAVTSPPPTPHEDEETATDESDLDAMNDAELLQYLTAPI